MKKTVFVLIFLLVLSVPVHAADLVAPPVPDSAADLMPDRPDNFTEGLWYVIKSSFSMVYPDLTACCSVCLGVISVSILLSIFQGWDGKSRAAVDLVGVVILSCLLLSPVNALITLGADTVRELSEYGKLLLPVMTAALAAQGGGATSATLYTATALFDTVLSSLVSSVLVPMVYIYLVVAIMNSAIGDSLMKKILSFCKWSATWVLKIILYGFTGYISITGVISGTADQTAVKAAKLTISGMVPVVGSILSDASETILVSAGVVKNTAGIYGLLALISIGAVPFLKIGVQYLLLKLTAAVCGMFAGKKTADLIGDFGTAMGLLLAMTGTVCLLLLISVVCYMKGME